MSENFADLRRRYEEARAEIEQLKAVIDGYSKLTPTELRQLANARSRALEGK